MRIQSIYSIFFTVLLFFIIGIFSASAKEKAYTVKVYGTDNKVKHGTLKSVTDKGIYILNRTSKEEIFLPATEIRQIKLRRKGKSGTGTTIGFFSGLAVGAAGIAALHSDDKLKNTSYAVGAVLFTFISTAVGGAIGSAYDETVTINGKNEDYLQTLERLKSFAPSNQN